MHFSVRLEKNTVRQILDALCQADARYTWSSDGASINIYPRATISDASYLLNRRLKSISLTDVSEPGEALTPLAQQVRDDQIGYSQAGAGIIYPSPWTVTFQDLTVRRLINRVAEHANSDLARRSRREDVYF